MAVQIATLARVFTLDQRVRISMQHKICGAVTCGNSNRKE